MSDDEKQPAASKTVKKAEPEQILFSDFVLRTNLAPVWADGLQLHLALTGGTGPRPLEEWQAALLHYQALS